MWLERVFDRLDTDHNGFVDLQEIMTCASTTSCGTHTGQVVCSWVLEPRVLSLEVSAVPRPAGSGSVLPYLISFAELRGT